MMLTVRKAHLAHGRVRYVEEGEGPALLLLHGLGGNWQNWLANIPGLAERHRVIALDLPGFGLSDPLRGQVTMGRFADVAIELLDEVGVADATFVGNSMGGLLTIEAAVRHSARVSAAVLACSGGMPLTGWQHRLVILPLSRALNLALRHRQVRHRVLGHPVTRHIIASAVVRDVRKVDSGLLVSALDGLGAAGFGPALEAGMHYDARARAPHMHCATLVLWGRHDLLLPLWMGERLHELIAGSELVVWDDAGHCPQIEHPERFDALVAEFVAGRSLGEALSSAG